MRCLAATVALLVGVVACSDRPQLSSPERPGAVLSDERKAQIRLFWQMYRQATRLRIQGEWAATVPAYQKALELDPGHEDSLYYLGNVLFELARYAEAAVHWRKLLEVNPASSRAHTQLGVLYSCGLPNAPFDLDRAEREFTQALELNKEESGPLLKLGEVALLKGELERAFDYLNAVSRSNSRSPMAHYLMGYIHWQRGDGQAAGQALHKAVELSRASKASASASSEGDTRSGSGPLLAAGAGKGLFSPYLAALKSWDIEAITEAQMDAEFQRLREMLKK